jgi:hypothetical protein
MADDLLGFEVRGRHGVLGVVVAVTQPEPGIGAEMRVRGGKSDALLYVVPVVRVSGVARHRRMVFLDADVGDFVPKLRDGGVVELRLAAG